MYFQKFDVENSDGNLYWHQYMQNILAAQSEGTTLRKTLSEIGMLDCGYTFIIPVYENMPSTMCSRPSTTSTNKKLETDLISINVNSSLKMRKSVTDSTVVGYLYSGEIATRLEMGKEKINGTYWDKVLKSNGTVGYVARSTYDGESEYKLYLVSLKDESLNNNTNNNNGENNQNTGNNENQTSSEFIKGDVNSDKKVDSADLLYLKKYLLNKVTLDDKQKKAADTSSDGKVDSADLLNLKKFLLGKITL